MNLRKMIDEEYPKFILLQLGIGVLAGLVISGVILIVR